MVSLFGTTYYTIGTGLVVLVLLAPLLWGFSRWALRPNVEDKPRRTRLLAEGGLTAGLLLLAAVGLYWDVYLIGQRAKELCAETGLVVYRAAKAEGFAGSTAIASWSKYGFRFVEADHNGKIQRYRMTPDGPTKEVADKFTSEYKLDFIDRALTHYGTPVGQSIARRGAKITNLLSGEIAAELIEYTIRYGWLDRTLIGLTGFAANTRTCGRKQDGTLTTDPERVGIKELVLSTLIPH